MHQRVQFCFQQSKQFVMPYKIQSTCNISFISFFIFWLFSKAWFLFCNILSCAYPCRLFPSAKVFECSRAPRRCHNVTWTGGDTSSWVTVEENIELQAWTMEQITGWLAPGNKWSNLHETNQFCNKRPKRCSLLRWSSTFCLHCKWFASSMW